MARDITAAWVDKAESDGIGEWIEISSEDLETVNGIKIVNEYEKFEDIKFCLLLYKGG